MKDCSDDEATRIPESNFYGILLLQKMAYYCYKTSDFPLFFNFFAT